MSKSQYRRWKIFKALVVFQMKLALDWLRDLLLSPVAFFCALIDFVTGAPPHRSLFQQLMRFGQKSDLWINLFDHQDENESVDQWVDGVERKWRNRKMRKTSND